MPSQPHEEAVAFWQAFLSSMDPNAGLDVMRSGYEDTMLTKANLPNDLSVTEMEADEFSWFKVSVKQSEASNIIVFFHGGGYICGSTKACLQFLANVAHNNKATIYSIDYRLAPEAPFPAAVEDGTTAYAEVLKQAPNGAKISFMGESAGGGLALAVCQRIKERNLASPECAVLLSPWVDLTISGETAKPGAVDDPTVAIEMLQLMQTLYCGQEQPSNPLVSPLMADAADFPPIFLAAGTREVLYDDAARLASKAVTAGVIVEFHSGEGLAHIWPLIAPDAPESKDIQTKITNFLKENSAFV